MTPFLQLVAQDLYKRHGSSIQEVCLVFPGKRAGLFFNRHLSTLVDKPVWSPPIKTISELMTDFSGLQIADPLLLVFQLFETYRKVRKTEETFDNFYAWGEILLNDFDDIDKYLVDASQLFQNLSDIRDIENRFTLPEEQLKIIQGFWKNVTLYEAGPFKQEFLSVWAQLNQIYIAFKDNLRNQGIAYEGMVYRDVYEKLKSGANIPFPYKKFAIVGFNALNECEKEFFAFLDKTGKADFYWDYDQYYVSNDWHEAGFFIRNNLKTLPQRLTEDTFNNLTGPKNIQMISVPSDVGQTKMIATLLKDWAMERTDLTNTAVILADEQLLIPVLSSIPETVKDVNVTLGYPFRLTPVHSFIESVISVQRNMRMKGNVSRYYHKDVLALLHHPYVNTICSAEVADIMLYIVKNNRIFLTESELHKTDYLKLLFTLPADGLAFTKYLLQLGTTTAAELKKKTDDSKDTDFHLEYWFTFIAALNRLIEILKTGKIDAGMPVIFRIIRKMAAGLSVPFKGEPLAGLQVMGVLETRTLDFKNVILLSTNEGVLPKTEASVSYIPYNLRKGFGLPTIEHQDAIFAYYFYRIIQRAGNVALLYNSQPPNSTGEMSRFLYQLKYEQAFAHNETWMNFSITLPGEKEIVIPKNSEILDALNKYTQPESGFYLTPTALSAYLECSLRFYFKYIVKIEEKEEIAEDIEGSMFGKLLHYAMQDLYHPFLQKSITSGDIQHILKSDAIEASVMTAFRKEYFKNDSHSDELHGKSIIVKEVLVQYVKIILEKDKKYAPFTPIALEDRFKTLIKTGDKQVTIGGVVDRMDIVNENYRIIDYKTGNVESSSASIAQLFDRTGSTKKYAAIFQSLLYSQVVSQQENFRDKRITPGIYALRKIVDMQFDYHLKIDKKVIEDYSMVSAEFNNYMQALFAEIFNLDVPFRKVEDKAKCEYCGFKGICHR
jgi:hypothetical protein